MHVVYIFRANNLSALQMVLFEFKSINCMFSTCSISSIMGISLHHFIGQLYNSHQLLCILNSSERKCANKINTDCNCWAIHTHTEREKKMCVRFLVRIIGIFFCTACEWWTQISLHDYQIMRFNDGIKINAKWISMSGKKDRPVWQ